MHQNIKQIKKKYQVLNFQLNDHNYKKMNFIRKSWSSVGSVVEWLKRRDCDRHGLGSKPTRAIPLCLWERHFTALSPAW